MTEPEDRTGHVAPGYTMAADLSPWFVSAKDWRKSNKSAHNIHGIATSVAVFDDRGRLLIIQRASTDSMPNMWELPGGQVDDTDASILDGAARELFEETGLMAARFTHLITEGPDTGPGQIFSIRGGRMTVVRFTFQVEVQSTTSVQLNPKEHQASLWVTAQEVREQKVQEHKIAITKDSTTALMLEAFRMREVQTATEAKESSL